MKHKRKLVDRLVALITKTVNARLLNTIDCAIAPAYGSAFPQRPVFFLGAPRSGSTLIYQVLTEAFDVAYFSNAHCRWFGSPALAERLPHRRRERPASPFSSVHGTTAGDTAPSECGQWWYRFFRRTPAYVTHDDVDPKKMRCFRRSLLAFARAAEKPIVIKNLYATLRLDPLLEHIPEALFIIVKRDETANAHSLLEVRKKVFGSYETWWSMPTPDKDKLDHLPPHVQVVEQIRGIHALIDAQVSHGTIAADRCLEIQYEAFCADVTTHLRLVEEFLSRNNCEAKSRKATLPVSFPIRTEVRIAPDIFRSLVEYVDETS